MNKLLRSALLLAWHLFGLRFFRKSYPLYLLLILLKP